MGIRGLDAVEGDLRQSKQAQELALVNHRLSIELKAFEWKFTEVGLVEHCSHSTQRSLGSGRAVRSAPTAIRDHLPFRRTCFEYLSRDCARLAVQLMTSRQIFRAAATNSSHRCTRA